MDIPGGEHSVPACVTTGRCARAGIGWPARRCFSRAPVTMAFLRKEERLSTASGPWGISLAERHRDIRFVLCLCAIAAIPFLPALGGGFTNWDDNVNVTNNPYVHAGVRDGLLPLLTRPYWHLYVPVTYALFWAGYHLWGNAAVGIPRPEPGVPPRQRRAVLPDPEIHPEEPLGGAAGLRLVGAAPAPGRAGRLDHRAEGRAQRHARAGLLAAVHRLARAAGGRSAARGAGCCSAPRGWRSCWPAWPSRAWCCSRWCWRDTTC